MKKLFALVSVLLLAGCGDNVIVKDSDLTAHLESQGYTKVMFKRERLNCGRFGRGKLFIAKTSASKGVIGQICYLKKDGKVSYKVDVRKNMTLGAANDNSSLRDPWNKNK